MLPIQTLQTTRIVSISPDGTDPNAGSAGLPGSDVKAEMEHITVMRDVFATLDPHFAGILGALLTVAGDKIVIGNGFSSNKPALEICMDDTGCFRGLRAPTHGPGPRFLGSGREKGDEIQQLVSGWDQLRRLAESGDRDALVFLTLMKSGVIPRSEPRPGVHRASSRDIYVP